MTVENNGCNHRRYIAALARRGTPVECSPEYVQPENRRNYADSEATEKQPKCCERRRRWHRREYSAAKGECAAQCKRRGHHAPPRPTEWAQHTPADEAQHHNPRSPNDV